VIVPAHAGVAQLVEQRICNPQVTGSSPIASSKAQRRDSARVRCVAENLRDAGVAERSMAADCKSAGGMPTVVQIHPPAPFVFGRGSNSGVESQPSKLLVAGSNPVSRSIGVRVETKAQVAQAVEHVLGKDGVTSSNLVLGSMNSRERGPARSPVTSRGPGRRRNQGGWSLEESRIGAVTIWCEVTRQHSGVSIQRGPGSFRRSRART
jgi:hypothetical protein